MTTIEFIKNELAKIAVKFPQVEIRYGYNHDINTHIVQFDPLDAYYNLPELDAMWISFSIEFDEKFIDESIAFIGADSILSITNHYTESWNVQPTDLFLAGFNKIIAQADLNFSQQGLPDTIIWNAAEIGKNHFLIHHEKLNFTAIQRNMYFPKRGVEAAGNIVKNGNEQPLEDSDKYAMAA